MPDFKKDRKSKKTIREIHELKVNELANIKNTIKARLGIKSDPTFYDMVLGRRVLNDGEKIIIAEAYGVPVDEIAWKEKKNLIA